jgi:sigma-B regulation protein RsbU (phosphoserine phosphatase)
MESTGLPLGFMKDYTIENSKSIKLTKENIVVFFTDGIMEAQSPKGKEFGFDRALDFIKCQQQTSAHQIVESLYKEIRSFSENQPQEDDITSVICKMKPTR